MNKTLLGIFVLAAWGCGLGSTEPGRIEYFSVHDTLYVDLTDYLRDTPFSVNFTAWLSAGATHGLSSDSFKVAFRYWLTKIDSQEVDSVWIRGYVFDRNTLRDVSEVYVEPLDGKWVYLGTATAIFYSMGGFDAFDTFLTPAISIKYRLGSLSKEVRGSYPKGRP